MTSPPRQRERTRTAIPEAGAQITIPGVGRVFAHATHCGFDALKVTMRLRT